MSTYQYEELPDEDYIRVLTIHPSSDKDARIDCTIEAVELSEAADYHALSYSWGMNESGDASLCEKLYITGAERPITKNLFQGLKRIRHASDSLRFWIDAVCINQKDVEERNSQVAMMPRIYRNASRVDVWLGEGPSEQMDEDVELLLSIFHETPFAALRHQPYISPRSYPGRCNKCGQTFRRSIGEQLLTASKGSADLRIALQAITDPANWTMSPHNSLITLPKNEATWLHVAIMVEVTVSLLRRRYYKRRWIVQELFHAHPDRVTVRWGASINHTRCFTSVFETMETYIRVIMYDFQNVLPMENVHPRLCRLREVLFDDSNVDLQFAFPDRSAVEPHSLLEFMSRYSSLECQDDRDRVFSLLSVDPKAGLVADYSNTTAETFMQFTAWLMDEGQFNVVLRNLSLYRSASLLLQPVPNLPSWAMNLRPVFSYSPGYDLPRFWHARRGSRTSLHCDLACLGSVTYTRKNGPMRILSPSGSLYAELVRSHDKVGGIEVGDLVYSTFERLWPKRKSRDSEPYNSRDNFLLYMRPVPSEGKDGFAIVCVDYLDSKWASDPVYGPFLKSINQQYHFQTIRIV